MADDPPAFLADLHPRPWEPQGGHGLRAAGLFIGPGTNGIEVAAARADAPPSRQTLQDVWKDRRDGRAAPVLLAVLHPQGASLCGASGEQPPVYQGPNGQGIDSGQAERLCREVLAQPDRHAALRFLAQALPSLETELAGLNNEGLLALHELQSGAREQTDWAADWTEAGRKARAALGKESEAVLTALGFQVEELDNLTKLLRGGERRTALAVMLRETESPEAGVERFNNLSPVSYALSKADQENLPWVIMVQGSRVRLYSTSVNAGVGRRGRTETYVEFQISLLSDEHLSYLWLLCSADALAPDGSLDQLLESSRRFSGDLAERLRNRIYNEVVPALAQGVARARNIENPGRQELTLTYEMALTVLFRLLFVAYAEDRDLLPYRFNDAYRQRSLKQKARELADYIAADTPVAEGENHWREAVTLWRAVAEGNNEWGVPAYNGGLFTDDADVSPAGAALAEISVPNETFELALRALLVTTTPEGVPGPVDFRSLGVREFGTIYEGLLESELAQAEVNLTIDSSGGYKPAREGETYLVQAGEIYLHNRSGARKSSGSYYTKPFAVEHLLNTALEPALAEHFARLDDMDDEDAAGAFFDFRTADIAMGSGHFLIAAIDYIEKGMADYLMRRPLPGVRLKLAVLREAAETHLSVLAESVTIEDSQLLRRMTARHCIYGVDLNNLSVQLARLAVWIHTFVPGLPLSVLDHNLVHGNALVGIGAVDDIRTRMESVGALLAYNTETLLGDAAAPLRRLANINDATLDDVAAAREAHREAREAVRTTEALCDLITAGPISTDARVSEFPFEDWERAKDTAKTARAVETARQDIAGLHPLHFPVAFPEVFLRARPGFDVIIGNPPWEKVKVEERVFWARHFPGIRGLKQSDYETEKARLIRARPDLVTLYETEIAEIHGLRKALAGNAYPGMGTGDPDLYKAFCWRFWHLTAADGGRVGVVLPRSALSSKGSEKFRFAVFNQAASVDITTILNRGRWAFEMEPRYTIGLVCIAHGVPEGDSIYLRGPYTSLADFEEGIAQPTAAFGNRQVLSWNDSASLPLLPSQYSVEVFAQLREFPRLDLNEGADWRARPYSEMHAGQDKRLMDFESPECPDGYWPVYKGESFDLWTPDTGDKNYYAYADPAPALEWMQNKRVHAGKTNHDSPHKEFPLDYLRDTETLPCCAPRVAFRKVARSADSRTIIACFLPPRIFLTDAGHYFLWPRGDEQDQAFLLGVLSSIPLDWYARRFVEINVNFFIINPFPVPRPPRDNPGWLRVVELAGRLACPDDRFANWAEAVGVDCGPLEADEKADMIHELDAVVAHLYELSEAHLTHIFETFHTGWDYQPRLGAVLGHYRAWAGGQ